MKPPKMDKTILIISLFSLLVFSCSENSEIKSLESTVDSLKVKSDQHELLIDSLKWQQMVLTKVANNYEKLLKQQGIDASYSIETDSTVLIEIIEDNEEKFE